APVVRVGGAAQQTGPLQLVQAAGHPAGGEHQRRRELPGGEGVGLPGPAERGQDVELPARDPVPGVRLVHPVAHGAREPVDAPEDLHAGRVEIRPDLCPLLDDRVDGVPGAPLGGSAHGQEYPPPPVRPQESGSKENSLTASRLAISYLRLTESTAVSADRPGRGAPPWQRTAPPSSRSPPSPPSPGAP